MTLFRRRSKANEGRVLPADAPQRLTALGLYEGPSPGGDAVPGLELGQIVRKALEEDVEPSRVLAEMVEAADGAGGWAYRGAWEILDAYTPSARESEPFLYILDRAIDDMQANGYTAADGMPQGMVKRLMQREQGT